MALEIGGLFWCGPAFQIPRRSHKERGRCAYPERYQCGIVDLTDADLQVDTFFDEIAKLVVQDEIE